MEEISRVIFNKNKSKMINVNERSDRDKTWSLRNIKFEKMKENKYLVCR